MFGFHPAVSTWFEQRFREATEPQREGWPVIQRGEHTLVAAPTGSGKTLAAFLCAIDRLVRRGLKGELADTVGVLYLSPLKALANDVRQNLLEPLTEIGEVARSLGIELPEIRALVRTGDTTPYQRRKTLQRPPHILVTTPESLFILLTSSGGRDILKSVATVIVDEIHALARDKRGSHLALSLERLEALTGAPFQRIGLSATQKPIEAISSFLTGPKREATVVDVGHQRPLQLAVEVPGMELGAVASHELWEEIYDRLAFLAREHRTTLVFVNTRRMAERTAHHLGERLGGESVAAHHGSLARETRLEVERRLKEGDLKLVVATASLELGIDVGSIDLVCQIGSTRSIALALQRVGRSGHWRGAIPKGRLFATTRDELLECAALVDAIRSGILDRIRIPMGSLDILAQQIVAAAAVEEWQEETLFDLIRGSHPYAALDRSEFDSIVEMLAEGISSRQGRRGAYLHRDRVNGKIRGRRGARLAAITSGGAIPDNANYLVKADPDESVVGDLDEDFAVESMRGDIFLLGNTSWRIRRIEAGVVRVEDAGGAPPNVPFWRGEAPARTDELSEQLSRLRAHIGKLRQSDAVAWLQEHCGLDSRGAQQAVLYVRAGQAALGAVPTRERIVAERFFDEAGGMQLVIHAPLGARINKAWGLALRKRFCRSFNFELQAAATDDGIVISLSDQHSFPLESIFSFLSSYTARQVLVQALLAVPLFGVRWRWTASRALAVLRFSGGRKVPPPLLRMRSDDLLAGVFPEQAACLENIQGDIAVPEHPLVQETLRDCLGDAMDVEGFEELLRGIEEGKIQCLARDTREPSPFCQQILNAYPYAFLDDAPLEERRARAVQSRRTLLPAEAADLAALDAEAIERVAEEAWPPLRSADEVHDALLTLGIIGCDELEAPVSWLQELTGESRVFRVTTAGGQKPRFWVAAERCGLIEKAYPGVDFEPPPNPDARAAQWKRDEGLEKDEAIEELVRCRIECTGPATALELGRRLSLPTECIAAALHRLESQGQVLRGSYRPGIEGREWCDRRLLARIHRLTVGRLRREIEPVSAADFMRFLLRWQHVGSGARFHGEEGTNRILDQLQGFESAAAAWESFLLPARVSDYSSQYLDQLCLSGQFTWARLTPPTPAEKRNREAGPGGTSGTRANFHSGRRRVAPISGVPASTPRQSHAVRPTRIVPVAFFRRLEMSDFFRLARQIRGESEVDSASAEGIQLSHPAREILELLNRWGASFFQDLVPMSGRLPVEVESGLWELVASGLVSADGFANLRALIDPKQRRSGNRHPQRQRLRRANLSVGRWTVLELPGGIPGPDGATPPESANSAPIESLAWQLLRRWGVMVRDLLARESLAPPWRDLLMVYRRLEAQGRVRGGRFVAGLAGEQFALPEALEALRTVRRGKPEGEVIRVSAADPLNLVGIILPGARVRPHPETFLYYRDGVPMADPQLPPLSLAAP